ncbi:MAG: 3-isopropylmalate dehydratase small subunit [Planctomycetales bacterium]
MQKIEQVQGRTVPLPLDDIDTDRIIPARFLRCVTFEGLGEHSFEDDRKQDPEHPFNKPHFQGGSILLAGRNFGCGSSREHAPQALIRWGIKALIAESFAEIFFGNCTSNGVPCVSAPPEEIKKLAEAIEKDPKLEVTVDVVNREVRYGATKFPVKILDSAHKSLTSGQWDFLSQLVEAKPEIQKTASHLPYMTNFA